MGFESRDYAWESPSRRAFLGGGDRAVKAIILANVALFVVQVLTAQAANGIERALGGPLEAWLGLIPDRALFRGELWRLFTYGWLHGNFWHIFWNMYLLWLFGRSVEQRVGTAEFAWFYGASVVAGGVVFAVLEALFGSFPTVCIGASGAVMAVTALLALWDPHRQLMFFGLIPVPLWAIAGFYALYESYWVLMQIGSGVSDGTAHGAHFGGLLVGWAYHRFGWNLAEAAGGLRDRLPRVKLGGGGKRAARPSRRGPALKVYRAEDIADEDDLDARADAVLAKISASGEASLTKKERAVLKEASERAKARRRGR